MALGATEVVVVAGDFSSELPPPQEPNRARAAATPAARMITEHRGDEVNFISNTLYNIME